MNPLATLAAMSPSRRWQHLGFVWSRFVTAAWHARHLRACGRGTIVRPPMFWTPEFIELGSGVLVWEGCRLEGIDSHSDTRFEPRLVLEDRVSLQQNCHLIAAGELRVGAGTTVSFDVMITDVDHEHDVYGVNVLEQPLRWRRTAIGRHCFIGAGARVLAGTVLDDNCMVGANAVVRGEFAAGSLIAGVPARVVKRWSAADGRWNKVDRPESK